VTLFYVTVEDRLPDGLTFVSASSGGVYIPGSRTIIWLLDTLDPGASLTLTYTATVNTPGYWTNGACAAAADELGNNISDCDNATVTGGEPTRTPTPTSTPVPTGTPTQTPQPAGPPQRTPTPTITPTLRPGAPTITPVATNTPTATGTPVPPAPPTATPVPPTPTLTTVEEEVEEEVNGIVQEREKGGVPQVPAQVPGG
jgi:hypothetical protein